MALAYEKIMSFRIPDAEQHLTRRDTMLYALGVGLGADPCDTNQLKFVYEKNLEALPTMAIILGYAGQLAREASGTGHHRHATPCTASKASESSSGCRWKETWSARCA